MTVLDALDEMSAELETIDTGDPASATVADAMAVRLARMARAPGNEEIAATLRGLAAQMRKVAAFLFGYLGPRKAEMSKLTWADVDYRKGRVGAA